MDATGNQCNDGAAVGAYADGSDIPSPPRTAKLSSIEQSVTAQTGPRPTARVMAARRSPTEGVKGVSRFAMTVAPPQLPVKTSKVEVPDSSPCSGESDGGGGRDRQPVQRDVGARVEADEPHPRKASGEPAPATPASDRCGGGAPARRTLATMSWRCATARPYRLIALPGASTRSNSSTPTRGRHRSCRDG
jgi:hypothetical protein